MTQHPHSDPALPATAASLAEVDETPSTFDINGFDPADFEWRPVPRRPRADGWSPEVQRRFIAARAETGLVEAAARAVDTVVAATCPARRNPPPARRVPPRRISRAGATAWPT